MTTSAPTTANATVNLAGLPRAAHGGNSPTGTNFAADASASSAPRASGDAADTSAQTSRAATSVSFELVDSAKRLYGKAAHAYASAIPSARLRSRRPRT